MPGLLPRAEVMGEKGERNGASRECGGAPTIVVLRRRTKQPGPVCLDPSTRNYAVLFGFMWLYFSRAGARG